MISQFVHTSGGLAARRPFSLRNYRIRRKMLVFNSVQARQCERLSLQKTYLWQLNLFYENIEFVLVVTAFLTPCCNGVGLVAVRQEYRLCFRDLLKAVSAWLLLFARTVELHEEKLWAIRQS